jgi:hypothetical protein
MATDPARITTPERQAEDADAALRPKSLDEFVGQKGARENLRVFISAAKSRGDSDAIVGEPQPDRAGPRLRADDDLGRSLGRDKRQGVTEEVGNTLR